MNILEIKHIFFLQVCVFGTLAALVSDPGLIAQAAEIGNRTAYASTAPFVTPRKVALCAARAAHLRSEKALPAIDAGERLSPFTLLSVSMASSQTAQTEFPPSVPRIEYRSLAALPECVDCGQPCTQNGTPCCGDQSCWGICAGKFPNTYCGDGD